MRSPESQPVITTVCVLFRPTPDTPKASRCFGPEWVDKLYRGVKRNTTFRTEFVCLTDQAYEFEEIIQQRPLKKPFDWKTVLQQAFSVECERMMFMGLDTIITGNIDGLLNQTEPLIVPRDPNHSQKACSGFVLSDYKPEISALLAGNDMEAINRSHPHFWDDICPGWVKSYKCQVKKEGLGDARVVYFHGMEKPHEIDHEVIRHWR